MHLEIAAPNGHPATLPIAAAVPYEPAIILFGRDEGGKAHASTFGAIEREVARTAASLMSMATWEVPDQHLALARQMPKGRVFASGKAFVPFIAAKLMAELEAVAGPARVAPPKATNGGDVPGAAQRNAGKAPKGVKGRPITADAAQAAPDAGNAVTEAYSLPAGWSTLTVGDLVLALEGPGQGYFEAVIAAIDVNHPEVFRLTWRDYADLGPFTRRIEQLALLHPESQK